MSWPFGTLERQAFGCIVADPPWRFKSRTALQMKNFESRRDAEKHYAVLPLEEIAALPVKELSTPSGCHLFLWTTGPMLPSAIEIMSAWGFKYSSVAFTWVKLRRSYDAAQLRILPSAESDLHVGLGLTTRKNCEFVLLGRRGNCKRMAKNIREVIMTPVREHSRKPDEMFSRVERYCSGPYVELFSREARLGWEQWGNETTKFAVAAE